MKPYFSIIIPTLNEEKCLPRLLKELAKQKEKNFEIIIADSHSSDKTKELTADFKTRLNLRFFDNERKNVSFQRNFGASHAQGDYLIFLDADSEVSPAFTQNLKKTIDKKKGLFFIPHNLPDRNFAQYRLVFDLVNKLVELSQNLNKPFSSGGSMIIERYFFKKLGGFNDKLFISEDHDLVQRANRWGVRTKYLSNIKVRFSLRRMKKEGQLRLLYKYLIAATHSLFKGEVKKKIFEYEMGGQAYSKKEGMDNKEITLEKYLQQIKDTFKKILAD